ncbi:MAG: hypothetical protein IJW70_00195 [Clostridia bacterium]|nr:hypothetical protein [Clostridia bacterium]
MSFFQKNSSPMLPNQPSKEREPRERKPASKKDKLLLGLVLGCSVASTILYFFLISLSEHMEYLLTAQIFGLGVPIAYAAAGAIFLFVYIIYNRAFTRDHIMPEMLPDSMSEEQKQAFIKNGADCKRKSKWMIIVLFALFTPLAIDFLILTAIPTLFGGVWGQYLGA